MKKILNLLRKRLLLTIVLTVLLLGGGIFIFHQKAHAVKDYYCGIVAYGRCLGLGYFTNEQRMAQPGVSGNGFPLPKFFYYQDSNGLSNWWSLPPSVDNNQSNAAGNFIAYIAWALSQPYIGPPNVPVDNYQDPWYTDRELTTGAAFLIDTMLGYPGSAFGSGDAGIVNGIATAQQQFNRWANIITLYDADHLVEWNAWRVYGPHVNTTGVGVGYTGRDINPFWYDPASEGFSAGEFVPGIVFHDPTNYADEVYVINRTCANVTGNFGGLPQPTQPTISCNNLSTSPTEPEGGQTFSATGGFSLSGAPNGNFSYSINFNINGLNTGPNPVGSGTVVSGGTASATVGGLSANTGLYSGNFTVNVNGVGSTQCPASVTVTGKPYLRVYGGDVLAGSGFNSGSTSCEPDKNAQILGFNKGDAGGSGAGTQFAAQSTSAIDQFSSALLRSSSPTPLNGLTFANNSGGYGGNFGSGICAQDYYDNATNGQPPAGGSSSYSNGSIADGQHIVIKYKDNLEINGNISYADYNWASLSQIPSIYVIVEGNIYIDSNVTNLDGVYIAQPDPNNPSTTGRIYTCTNPNFSFVNSSNLSSTCNNKLTINGAFIAQQVRFLRTNGSLNQSSSGEASTSSTIAEVFNFDPELWLVNPGLTNSTNSGYDSISSLPPVL